MNPRSLLGHCTEVLGQILRSRSTPADVLVSSYARTRKYLGAKERRALSEIVFATLRTKNTAEYITTRFLERSHLPVPPAELAALIGAVAAVAPCWADFDAADLLHAAAGHPAHPETALAELYQTATTARLPDDWTEQLRTMLAELVAAPADPAALGYAACIPPWIAEHLLGSGWTSNEVLQLGRALMRPAPLTLRRASPAITREQVLETLHREGIAAYPTRYSPDGITLEHRVQLLEHPLYRNGSIEIQDEGSQLVGYAVDPAPNWRILDACAGAGGKTLHIAQLQHDRGYVVASDTEPRRLQNLRQRLRRHRFRSIHIEMLAPGTLSKHRRRWGSFDAVLLDVPCSGTGTLRRAPEIKWRLEPRKLERIVARQEQILRDYAPCVRPGGVVLYVTCSLLPAENEHVIERFLREHPDFAPDPITPALERWNIPLVCSPTEWQLRLLPHVHGTDGFFIARLRRL
jgi:16S rRNA (cytosine967-C5)-methyltransferase